MTRRSFRSELTSLIFALNANPYILADANARKIIEDFDETLLYYRTERRRRYLIWGLLIGRSVDSFTNFFLAHKRRSITGRHNTFNSRIYRICDIPLTRDPSINIDLRYVKNKRNDLFHEAGRHFSQNEMKNFVFKSVKSLLQLVSDL